MTEGLLTLSGVRLPDGTLLPAARAIRQGLVKTRVEKKPRGWGIAADEITLGYNTMVDNGRQFLAYLFGGRSPAGSFVCSHFGVGTGTASTTSSYTALESPVQFYDDGSDQLQSIKPITAVDFPVPYVARVEYTLALTEANGTLITEFGLFAVDMESEIPTLLCRKTEMGLEKTSAIAPVFLWRIRF